jgi:TM2 domain-containing membrane protein YozV
MKNAFCRLFRLVVITVAIAFIVFMVYVETGIFTSCIIGAIVIWVVGISRWINNIDIVVGLILRKRSKN